MRLIILFTLVLSIFCGTATASGGLDLSFAPQPHLGGGNIRAFAVQPDGKIILGGVFGRASGVPASLLTRINPDGTIDPTFHGPIISACLGGTCNLQIYDIVLQSDGKIIFGGNFVLVDGIPHPTVARLNTDGTLDPSFAFNPAGGIGGAGFDLDLQADGKLLIAGATYNAVNRGPLTRVNTDGSVDLSFDPGNQLASAVKALPDGKVLVAQPNNSANLNGFVRRLNSDGSVDATFLTSFSGGIVTRITALADGNFFITGDFTAINNVSKGRATKISNSGALDKSFNSKGSGFDGFIWDANQEASGKIIVSGAFSSYNGTPKPVVLRLNENGTLDNTFADYPALTGAYAFYRAFPVPGGKYIVTGYKGYPNPSGANTLGFAVRLNNDGTSDNTFNTVYTGGGGSIANFGVFNDGRIVVGGRISLVGNQPLTMLARFDNNGVFDPTFLPFFNGIGMNTAHFWIIEAFVTQPDNKMLVAGQTGVRRINPDGTFDPGFNTPASLTTAEPTDLLLLPDGKMLVAGSVMQRPVIRLNSNGSFDPTFEEGQLATNFGRSKLALQSDGKVIIAGEFLSMGGSPRNRIARLNSNGSLDNSFNPIGGVNGRIFSVAVQPDDKIVIGGEFTMVNGFNKKILARLNPDGTTDNSFSADITAPPTPGSVNIFTGVVSLKLLKTGKILIGGDFSAVDGQPRNKIAMLNPDGSLDTTFDVGGSGPDALVRNVTLQPNGRILVGGDFSSFNGLRRAGVARLIHGGPSFDFDGDGRSDISIYRPSDGNWYLSQSQAGFAVHHFGLKNDRVASADYDGDSKSDLAVYRDGAWWYIKSSDGTLGLANWGAAEDTPLPSDFDGDSKADFVYYHSSTGTWFRSGSTGAVSNVQFGMAGDIPTIGDFDGDGKSDPAIFRPTGGVWWYLPSSTGVATPVQWGQNGDVPVTGDYDGDGKTDLAVWRPSNGAWYILNSSNGSIFIFSWGLSEDRPVVGDYDGDGKSDIAVWRPSTGVWYIMQSTAGFTGMQYGLSSDKPVPNAFLP